MDHVVRVLGTIDRNASILAFTTALDSFIFESEVEGDTLANAVHSVFDNAFGKRLTAPTVVALAMTHLEFTPETYTALADKVKGFIQANVGEKGSALFSTRKGPGGGVSRWADEEPGAAAALAARIAAAAAPPAPDPEDSEDSDESVDSDDSDNE